MVIDKLDMSLDDISAMNRKEKAPAKRQGPRPKSWSAPQRGGGKGAGRRGPPARIAVTVRQTPAEGPRRHARNEPRPSADDDWAHDKFYEQYPADRSAKSGSGRFIAKSLSLTTTGVVTVSNIPWQVEVSDLDEQFRAFPDYDKSEIVYDRSGRATGAALIRFHKKASARKFVDKYNGVKLDGQVMTIVEGDDSAAYSGEDARPRPVKVARGRGPSKFRPRTVVRVDGE
ncbi:RNA recognition motif containing protein [Plasmodiophora brassicae]